MSALAKKLMDDAELGLMN
ncbi:hypothetical protein [Pseudomonas putida]|nr:hypothetical protein [Pseudomonas putida]